MKEKDKIDDISIVKLISEARYNAKKEERARIKEEIKREIINSPHIFSTHKGKGNFCSCKVCQVLNKLLKVIEEKS